MRSMTLTDTVLATQGRWLMAKLMPHKLIEGIRHHLDVTAPERSERVVNAIKARAKQLVEEDRDLAVDGPANGMLAMSAVVLTAYEELLPEFHGDKRRTILFLQHLFGEVFRRTMEVVVKALTRGDDPLASVDSAIRKSAAIFGSYFEFEFDDDPDVAEMRVSGACSTTSPRTTTRGS
jgi:hypothetical protein